MATSTPTNQSEYQLYRVLQRANLLQYYDTFIAQGGDDVQQLCEAGEEEFLEIMALVGMASKPLHVRRLQKSLQEWATNPNSFLMPTSVSQAVIPAVIEGNSILASLPQQAIVQLAQANATAAIVTSRMYQDQQPPATATTPTKRETLSPARPDDFRQTPSPAPSNSSLSLEPLQPPSLHNSDLISLPSPNAAESENPNVSGNSPCPSNCSNSGSIPITVQELDSRSFDGDDDSFRTLSSTPTQDSNRTSPGPHAQLKENEINALAEAAARLAQKLPHYEAKRMNLKKQICREIEALVQMPIDASGRLDLMRKYGAIYGRFDSKRKNEKPMSLHEISVNEASAQLCWHRPGLLTRREELFPLARDVVRASGYQYAKGHSRAQGVEQPPSKRIKFTEECQKMVKSALQAETDKSQERLSEISQELQDLTTKQEKLKIQMNEAKSGENYAIIQALSAESEAATAKQLQLLTEQSDLMRKQRKSHKNRYSKHGIHTVDDMYENGYPAMYTSDLTTSPPNGDSASSDVIYSQEEVVRSGCKRSAKKTQLFVQESLFDEGLRIAQQYGMADFAEEIKGLIKHDNVDEAPDSRDRYNAAENGEATEINGNYKEDSNTCDSQGSQNSRDNTHETEGTSSQEQNKLIENTSDIEESTFADDMNNGSNGVRVFNIVPLSESDESNTDLVEGPSGVACS